MLRLIRAGYQRGIVYCDRILLYWPMKLRAILSFKLRWADPEGLVDRGWPQTSDSTTTSLASVVYCESTRIGLRRAALISQRWMVVDDWKELLANASLSTRSTGEEYKYYCSMMTRCLSALCRRCLSVFSLSRLSPETKIDCGWIPKGAVGGSGEWQRHLVSAHVIENFSNTIVGSEAW